MGHGQKNRGARRNPTEELQTAGMTWDTARRTAQDSGQSNREEPHCRAAHTAEMSWYMATRTEEERRASLTSYRQPE